MVQGNQIDSNVSRRGIRTMLSRRGVMAAAVASAAIGLTRMAKVPTVEAAGQPLAIGIVNNSSDGPTVLARSGGSAGLNALTLTNSNGDAFAATSSTNIGVNAGGLGAGVLGSTSGSGGTGIQGTVIGQSNGYGVLGQCNTSVGVWGASASNIGTIGSSQGSHGVFGGASANSAAGVFGTTTNSTGTGVTGTSVGGIGIQGTSTSNVGVYGITDSSVAIVGRATGSGKGAQFFGDVEITGNFVASGMKSAAVKVSDGSTRRVYCLESPVSYFEDMGTGQVTDGRGSVTLDPMFLSTVTSDQYQVYLTPEGDCQGLYVEGKSSGGFTVRELMGGTHNVSFAWRVVAKRAGIVNERFAPVKLGADPVSPSAGSPKPASQHMVEVPTLPDLPGTPAIHIGPR